MVQTDGRPVLLTRDGGSAVGTSRLASPRPVVWVDPVSCPDEELEGEAGPTQRADRSVRSAQLHTQKHVEQLMAVSSQRGVTLGASTHVEDCDAPQRGGCPLL